MKDVSRAAVVEIPIAQIAIGERRRDKLGKVRQLANSIAARGLIHPILVRGGTLVAGRRRLEACRLLGWKKIPARQVDRLSDDELRAIELEENTHRENLSDFATSKARLAQIRQAEADTKSKAEVFPTVGKTRGGRPPKRRSARREIAEATGVSESTQERTERHVEIAERYPFMQRPTWLQHHVLEAAPIVEAFTERDRPAIAALLDQDAIPAKTAIGILQNLTAMPAEQRGNILRRAQSQDADERLLALTQAAAVPPPVDPGLTFLGDGEAALVRAAKACRSSEFRPQIAALATTATQLHHAFREANAHARRENPPSGKNGHGALPKPA